MKSNYNDLFTAFYQKVSPEKIKDVDDLLHKYQGKEEVLFSRMCLKYGINGQEFLNSLNEKPLKEDQEYNLLFPKRKKKPILLILGLVLTIVCLIILFNNESIFNETQSSSKIGEKVSKIDGKILVNDFVEESDKNVTALQSLKIISIQTGFNPNYKNPENSNDHLWLPCVAIKFENISNNDIKEYIKVSAIFIDNNKNEQIGSDLAFLASSSESLLSHTSKQLSLTSGSGWAYFVNKSVTVKIYVGDEFVKSLKISNNEFDGTIQ